MSELKHHAPCFLFAGPTLNAPGKRPPPLPMDITLCPPAGRGDIEALIEEHREGTPGTIILVDGVFHLRLAVSHAEIRKALAGGWQVWGLSSMGAIRAREMYPLGMKGYGYVYERFLAEEDFQDDEVSLIHEAEPPYRYLSEPLIHLRTAIADLQNKELLSVSAARRIVNRLKALWYGDRTRVCFDAMLQEAVPVLAFPRTQAALADFHAYRVKTHDLMAFLQDAPWRNSASV